jgi:hypothetical protein
MRDGLEHEARAQGLRQWLDHSKANRHCTNYGPGFGIGELTSRDQQVAVAVPWMERVI